MRALWLVNQLWVTVPVNPRKNRASSELLYKSNRPQVSMGYRLINHLWCWPEEFVNHSPATRGLQILLVFYQHPAWFISLKPIVCLKDNYQSESDFQIIETIHPNYLVLFRDEVHSYRHDLDCILTPGTALYHSLGSSYCVTKQWSVLHAPYIALLFIQNISPFLIG